jgi:hypothetical protein
MLVIELLLTTAKPYKKIGLPQQQHKNTQNFKLKINHLKSRII